jgi:hypothetical protein
MESAEPRERRVRRYVDDANVEARTAITVNVAVTDGLGCRRPAERDNLPDAAVT